MIVSADSYKWFLSVTNCEQEENQGTTGKEKEGEKVKYEKEKE